MKKFALALTPMMLVAMAARADNCEAIKSQIEARFRAGGMAEVVLAIVDAGEPKSGRVAGTCASGARQIVVSAPGRPVASTGAVAAPAASATGVATAPRPAASGGDSSADRIPTECKDGSIVIGPNCNDPLAPRLSNAELSKLVVTPP